MRIAVILSTYNGGEYVGKQIKSILAQEGVSLDLFVRDDGSTDATKQVVLTLAKHDKRIHFVEGQNLGFKRSFFELLNDSRISNYDYFAYADQDDLWKPNKLSVMEANMVNIENGMTTSPLLLYSNGRVFSDQGLGRRIYQKPRPVTGVIDAVFRPLYGMSFLFNRALRDLLIQTSFSHFNRWGHDGWTAIVASFTGRVMFVNQDLVLYRQHGDNASGLKKDYSKLSEQTFRDMIINFKKRQEDWKYKLSSLADELEVAFSGKHFLKENTIVQRLVSCNEEFVTRMQLLFSKQFTAHSKLQDIVIRSLLLRRKV